MEQNHTKSWSYFVSRCPRGNYLVDSAKKHKTCVSAKNYFKK